MTENDGAGRLKPFDDSAIRRVLCVAAHPDDIEYGMAAAVHRWTGGGKAAGYYLLARGEAGIDSLAPAEAAVVREREERDGAALVGVERVEFGDHPDGVIVDGLGLRRDIAAVIRDFRPDLVLTGTFEASMPGGFLNQSDHRLVGLATLDACADAGNRWIFPELIERGLEPWHVGTVALAFTSRPTHYVDVSSDLDAAVASLEAHRTYNEALPAAFPKPRELLTSILGGSGRAAGVEYALSLEVFGR